MTTSESIDDYGRRLLIGAHLNIAADRGSKNKVVRQRAREIWEKQVKEECRSESIKKS